MQNTPTISTRPHSQNWVYTSLTVIDGLRHLKPTRVAFDRLLFSEPPKLASAEVEIILTNGRDEQRHMAIVLPHDSTATRISIRLLPPHQVS